MFPVDVSFPRLCTGCGKSQKFEVQRGGSPLCPPSHFRSPRVDLVHPSLFEAEPERLEVLDGVRKVGPGLQEPEVVGTVEGIDEVVEGRRDVTPRVGVVGTR